MPNFIAKNASVMGKVTLGDNVSIWYGAVVRADVEVIVIGDDCNVQDTAVIHADPGAPALIGKGVTIGHRAIVHGAKVDDYSMIGMGATILNNAKIGKFCIIGANALVTENMEIPDYSLAVGMPAKVIRQLPIEVEERLKKSAEHYINMAQKHMNNEFPLITE